MKVFPREKPEIRFDQVVEPYPFRRSDEERGIRAPHFVFRCYLWTDNVGHALCGLSIYDDTGDADFEWYGWGY